MSFPSRRSTLLMQLLHMWCVKLCMSFDFPRSAIASGGANPGRINQAFRDELVLMGRECQTPETRLNDLLRRVDR